MLKKDWKFKVVRVSTEDSSNNLPVSFQKIDKFKFPYLKIQKYKASKKSYDSGLSILALMMALTTSRHIYKKINIFNFQHLTIYKSKASRKNQNSGVAMLALKMVLTTYEKYNFPNPKLKNPRPLKNLRLRVVHVGTDVSSYNSPPSLHAAQCSHMRSFLYIFEIFLSDKKHL